MNQSDSNEDTNSSRVRAPLMAGSTILDVETRQAVSEMKRPWRGLFISGFLAGFGMGTSILAVYVVTGFGGSFNSGVNALLIANAYTVGFILVILANTDLFTEYTTLAILPVLKGSAPLRQLARLWGLIYTSNLLGCAAVAVVLRVLGPGRSE